MRPSRRGAGPLLLAALLVTSVASPVLVSGAAVAAAPGGDGLLESRETDGIGLPTDRAAAPPRELASRVDGVSAARAGDAIGAPALQQGISLDNVTVTQEFRLTPSKPGSVVVRQYYVIPERVLSLNTTVPPDATVVDVDGFRAGEGRTYRWNGVEAGPMLTYELPVNETLSGSTATENGTDLRSVDAGEWALFRRPNAPTHYTYRSPKISFRHAATTVGPGAVGEWLVFLGEHEAYERQAHGQHFRLVVPAAANMTASPDRVLDSLANASDALRIGDRDEDVFVVAAPADDGSWGRVRGIQRGDADMWVRADQPVNSAENAWVHEYVHSRQQFELATKLEWFGEGTAAYYAALLTYQQDRISYDEFRSRLARGNRPAYDRTLLANRSTWAGTASYDKGALVAGRLDRQIRLASRQNQSFQAVVRSMNAADGRTSMTDFLGLLGRAGDTDVIDSGQRYVETASNLTAWNRTAHESAYSRMPPRIGLQLPEPTDYGAYRVTGPYRTATVGEERPIVVVPGERLTVDAVATNAGGQTGNATARLTVNGTVVDRTNGTVAANESTTIPLNHTFATPGRYAVGLDGENVTVVVERAATARLATVSVDRRQVVAGESVTVNAVVANDAPVPGAKRLVVSRNYHAVHSEQVRVAADSLTLVTFEVPLVEPGTAVLTVGGASPIEITVRDPANASTSDGGRTDESPATHGTTTGTVRESETTAGDGPGLGMVTLGGAVVALGALAALRSRS